MCSWAWNRTADAISFGVRQRRQVERAHHDPLVRDADADPPPSLCSENSLRRTAARLSMSTTSPSRTTPGASGATAARSTAIAAGTRLDGGDVAGLNVQANDCLPCGVSHEAPPYVGSTFV